MAQTPTQLVDGAKCIDACVPNGARLAVLIYQFGLLTGVTTPTALMEGAKCIDQCLPQSVSTRLAVLIYLMDGLVGGGGSGGVSFVTCGTGDPTTAPASGCGVYIDTSNDAMWIYRNGAWALKV